VQGAPDPTSTAPQTGAQAQTQTPNTSATVGATTAEPSATAEAQTPSTSAGVTTTPSETTAQAQTTTPSTTAQATTAATTQASADTGSPQPQTAQAVCAPRNTSVHFGARGSALSRQNQNAIEYAADAASVCNLQTVVIADSGEGSVSARRTAAIRQTLVRQGVPEERISVEHATEGAATGQVDVRMTFAGTAQAGPQTAANETQAAPPETQTPGGS
jgi:outer membrane protein OmpA-like peptidoglycan-associated protein